MMRSNLECSAVEIFSDFFAAVTLSEDAPIAGTRPAFSHRADGRPR